MRPEYYADLYRRYACYCRKDRGAAQPLYLIACGPHAEFYDWTEVLMREAGRQMHGLSLHYYCGSGRTSRSATRFRTEDWYAQLHRAGRLDRLIAGHSAIMDRHDPDRRVGLIVDEWGAWHEVEPGTNPRLLYQQNTIRDALVAALSLNILASHCGRVKMANLAQTVNVLQSVVLTRGEQMLLTPTYHVFEMYRAHQEAKLLPTDVESEACGGGGETFPRISAVASRAGDGTVHLSVCNLHHRNAADIACEVRGMKVSGLAGRVLTGDSITAHNTFDRPNTVRPGRLTGCRRRGNTISIPLAARSVAVVALR